MTVALGVLFMVLGAAIEVLDLTAVVLASLLVMFIYVELGSPYTWLVWLSTSLLAFVFYPGSLMWLVYLTIFGIYPILKGYIERLPRVLWLVIKAVFINAVLVLLVLFADALVGVPFFGEIGAVAFIPAPVMLGILFVAMNLAFFLYDRMIIVMLHFYEIKIRPKIKNILK